MKTYTDRKPPGWTEKPAHPVILVAGDEETELRKPLFAFSDLWRKVRRKTDHLFSRYPGTRRVDICTEGGEVLHTVRYDPPSSE
jgi:hypothetical protein